MSKDTEAATSKPFRLHLLGRFAISSSDQTVLELPTQKSKALVALIALAGNEGIDRLKAASMLWSRGTDAQARANLRQTLASIRKTLGDHGEIILSDGASMRIATATIQTDIAALQAGDSKAIWADLDALGPFLDGIRINEPDFEEWLASTRAQVLNRVSIMLFDMAEEMLANGAWNDAKKANKKLLSLDSFDEGAHRQAMRIFAATGAHAQALRHYDELAALLSSELGVLPCPPTQELMRSLRTSAELAPITTVDPAKEPAHEVSVQQNRSTTTSLAVFPFATLGSDDGLPPLSGIAEDIAIELDRFSTLNVALRHDKIAAADENLYAVEGSVRYSKSTARVSVQLIDGRSRNILWAERYDRTLDDGFEAQDDIVRCVAAAIPGRVQADVADRAARQDIDVLSAHELMLQGKMLRDALSADAILKARVLLERAITLDASNARAHMYLSDTHVIDGWLGLSDDESAAKALHHARLAIAADPSDVYVQDHLGFAFLSNGMWRDGQSQIEKALRKIANEVESNAWCGYAFSLIGNHEVALQEVLRSTERDPRPPASFGWIRAQVFSFNGQFDAVIEELLGASVLNSLAQAFLVGAYARLGRAEDASGALADFTQMRRSELLTRQRPVPRDTVVGLAGGFRAMWQRPQDWEHIASGLSLAGLPD